jgi:hypothetical protein
MHSSSGRPVSSGGGLRGVLQRARSSGSKTSDGAAKKDHPVAVARPSGDRKPAGGGASTPAPTRKDAPPAGTARTTAAAATAAPKPAAPKVPEPPAPPAAPVVKPRREKTDDEPRL